MEPQLAIEIVKASPYLGFVLLFIWFEFIRDQKRVENNATMEDRREQHEKAMQERQLQHDRDMSALWAKYIQTLVDQVEDGNQAIIKRLDEHEQESRDRYDRLGNTKEVLKALQERHK